MKILKLKYLLLGFLLIVVSACSSKPIFFKIIAIEDNSPIFCYSYQLEECINDNSAFSFITIREFSGDYTKENKKVWLLDNIKREKIPMNRIKYGVVPAGVDELIHATPLESNVYYQLNIELYFVKNSFNQYYTSDSFENLPTKENLEDPNFLAKAKGMSIIDCDSHTFLAWFNRSVYTFSKDQLRNPICL